MGKLIALLTDFGTKDGYNAVMKSVIKTITPEAEIIDITHEIPPQNVDEAAFVIWNVYKYFPNNTIFVNVVDPGVGSSRNIILAKTNKYFFLAPDNGLLKFIFSSEKIQKVYKIENKKYFLPNLSNTFHGRDIFSPVAAYLCKGIKENKFGPEIKPKTSPENFISISNIKSKIILGKIIFIDRFGNLITNILIENPEYFSYIKKVVVGKTQTTHFYNFYSQAKSGEMFGLIGSRNLLEISIYRENISKSLKAHIGMEIKLYLK